MKKNYITPEINVIQLDTLCGPVTASVYRGSIAGDCVGNFDVLDENKTKEEYKGLWGDSNNWGED